MAQQSTSGLGLAHPVQYLPPKEQPKETPESKELKEPEGDPSY